MEQERHIDDSKLALSVKYEILQRIVYETPKKVMTCARSSHFREKWYRNKKKILSSSDIIRNHVKVCVQTKPKALTAAESKSDRGGASAFRRRVAGGRAARSLGGASVY
ncbi:hypothetical protein EVAR_90777_1 [Eumeta japonica]|uniref:Uncharacterized protein n=1 Tax=Eumeta variegata TaxID=151549 RepID=A0A4C1YJ32_EUMVA|nr:hypothetical protein EVAR_90777_1 [Eumeta japonica]